MTAQTILPANTLSSGHDVANSARFDQPDGADSLTMTPGGTGSRTTFTVSFWVKRGKLGAIQRIFDSDLQNDDTYHSSFFFKADDSFAMYNKDASNAGIDVYTDAKFRDPSAWYNIVAVFDTTNGTQSERIRYFVNGVRQAVTGTLPNQNVDNTWFNRTYQHVIGKRSYDAAEFFSGYLAEFVFIDGSALDATNFGEFDSDSPTIWRPKNVSGLTFGSNGFYLDFQNAAELGTDVSGNSNTFAESNISDVHQTTDTCTNNFATMNPLNVPAANAPVLSNGNLNLDSAANANKFHGSSTIGVSSGKWYMEFKPKSGSYSFLGITGDPAEDARNTVNPGYSVSSWGYYQADDGGAAARVANDNDTGNVGGSWEGYAVNDIIGIALNLDTLQGGLNKLYFAKNGVWQNGTDPTDFDSVVGVVGVTPPASVPAGAYFFVMGDAAADSSSKAIANFGNPDYANSSSGADANGFGDFEYAPPTGFYSICSKNLAEFG